MEHREALALQLVRMRRTGNHLLTTLNALSPAIEIAIQQSSSPSVAAVF
jgi:hypothetical protein